MTETKIKLLVLTNTYEPKIDGVLTFVKEFMKKNLYKNKNHFITVIRKG